MTKLRILLIRGSAPNGVSFHRLFTPHNRLKLDEGYKVFDANSIEEVADNDLKTIDIVISNRTLTGVDAATNITQINRVKSCGAKYIVDVDDYWYLHHGHELSKWWNNNNMTSIIETNIKHADYVTVTHDYLGKKTKRDYHVFENGIDSTQDQFKVEDKPIEREIAFGWSGSSNHYGDIMLLKESLRRLNDEDVNYKMLFCGFNPDMKHCKAYERILSADYTANNYVNVEGQPVDKYGFMYDLLNVSLIPLVDTEFNNCKSNLKMLESGFKKKAVIVSNVHPYTSIINHGVNCLKVNPTDRKGWYKEIMKLIKRPEMITELSEQLYKDVQAYEIKNINKKRISLYDSIGSNPNNKG